MSGEQNNIKESVLKLRLSGDLHARATAAAEKLELSVSALTRLAMIEYLEKHGIEIEPEEAAA